MTQVPPSALPELRAESLAETIQRLCALGNRFVGSPGERAARELVLEEFRRAGVANARLEELSVLGYRPEGASCELVGGGPELPAVGLQFTASGAAEGEAVFVGRPMTPEDAELLESRGVSLRDKIVVFESFWPFGFAEGFAAQGAAGLVVISENPEGRIGHFTAQIYPTPEAPDFAGRPLPIPGVTIEAQAARKLLALMSIGRQRLRIEHRAAYVATPTANVIGEVVGQEAPEERVVIGAHYDTQLEGVGACDNATGVATVVELARTWAPLRLRRTVVLVAFANEEHGFWGSVDYCRRHPETLNQTIGMVNLDVLGWVYPCERSLHSDPAIRDFAVESAAALGWRPDNELEASLLAGSDHNPFIDAGVPACWFWRYPPQHPFYHALGDDLELLDYDRIAETATVSAYTVLRLAQEPELDLGRSRPTKRWIDLRPPAEP